MAARVIHLLGVSHPDKLWLADQLAQALRERGHQVLCLPDPWFEYWQRTGQRADASTLAELTQRMARPWGAACQSPSESSLVLVTQPWLNWWAMSTCMGLEAGDSAQAVADLAAGFMTLLLAAPVGGAVGPGGLSDGVHAHRLEDELRRVLYRAQQPYSPLWGEGQARLAQALMLIEHALDEPARLARAERGPRWRWLCETCDDGACEHASLNLLG
jgi:hypothetical protein